MAKMIVKRVGVLSIAKMEALILAVFGLIIGVFYGMFFALLSAAMSSSSGNSIAVGGMGIAAVFIFPIIYGILGFIAGAIGALLYNFAAGFMGGVELELENAEQAYGAPPPQSYQNPYGAPYGGGGPSQ
jgi:hypothetical protein